VFRSLRRLWFAFWTRLGRWQDACEEAARKQRNNAGWKLDLEQLEDRNHPNDLIGTAAAGALVALGAISLASSRSNNATTSFADNTSQTGVLSGPTPNYDAPLLTPAAGEIGST